MGSIILIIIFLLIGLIIWSVTEANKKEEEETKQRVIEYKKKSNIFEEKKKLYNIKEYSFNKNEDYSTVNYKNGYAIIAKAKSYIWIEEEKLCFFPSVAQSEAYVYKVYSIPLKDIEYYATQGSISKETKISGGGGEIGGSSIGGAMVGGVIAGGAGAIIGSRKKGKIEPIKSEIIKHDNRETFLNYFIDGVKHSMFFNYEDYAIFLKVIPEKEYNKFLNTRVVKGSKQSFKEQLIDLADLKEKGILTEEEFNKKKKILLDKIK